MDEKLSVCRTETGIGLTVAALLRVGVAWVRALAMASVARPSPGVLTV